MPLNWQMSVVPTSVPGSETQDGRGSCEMVFIEADAGSFPKQCLNYGVLAELKGW